MSVTRRASVAASFVLLLLAAGLPAAYGQGNPKPDVNIIGPTADENDIRDVGLKQQNEPACAMRPGDGDCIICFYNDYRTVDILGHEDGWIGVSESCDAGSSWRSRVTPGHPNHISPIGTKFAADPRAIAIPGMTIHGFIGGFRDQDSGVIAVQHWLENNKEDADFNEPARDTIIVHEGTEGRFIDKPEFEFVMGEGNPQPTTSLSFVMENPELGTITRDFPSGTLYAAFAVFTGSQSVKLLVKRSYDLGKTWDNQVKKLTESQNLVSGITMTTMGNMTMAMWRQVQDVNDFDAIYYATTTNGGNSWTKPKLLTEICRFDQPSVTQTTPPALAAFRTNDFPWLATDGEKIYAFYTQRVGGCQTGVPKVFVRYTSNGNSWAAEQPIDSSLDAAPGAQFMPAAFGARGKVQVAWYDTRRENIPVGPSQPFVADYIPSDGFLVNRKVDVYTARITSSGNSINISDSVRVSQFRTVRDASDPSKPAFEIEASFANAKMFSSGFLAFIGDYIAVTAQQFRDNGTGGWEENYSAVPGGNNLTDFFIAYADNRDVRGDVLFDGTGNQSGYTPTDNVPAGEAAASAGADEQIRILAAEADEPASPLKDEPARRSTEGLPDEFTDPATACVPNQDRTRDGNVYGAVIRDELRLSTPVASRPLAGILRAIPFVARDVSSDPVPVPPAAAPPKPYRLYIANQPGSISPPNLNRASFRQKPFVGPFDGAPPPVLIEDVEIERNSAIARTVFLVSPEVDASVDVEIYDGVCAQSADDDGSDFSAVCDVLGSITLGGRGTAGPLVQPDYLSTQCATPEGEPVPEDCNVQVTELHNPLLENINNFENPLLENPLLENPLLENIEVTNPLLENPLLENLGYQNPLLENPLLENPLLENISNYQNPLLENPLLENPLLENSAYASGELTYADKTAIVRNDGNVATAYNFDATAANFTSTAGGDPVAQIIIWKQYVTATSRDCELRPEVRNQIITTINQPDDLLSAATIDNPFAGEASMILGPGEQGFVTYRFFGTEQELDPVFISGFTASAQAANCDEFDDNVGPGPGEDPVQFYTCEEQIADDRERILIEIDATPPVFDGLVENQVIPSPPIEANAPGGACLDPVALGLVTATDAVSPTVTVECVNAEGDAICTAVGGMGLSVPVSNLVMNPGPSQMTCTATDDVGNSASINLFLDVVDTTSPVFTNVAPDPTTVNADSMNGLAMVNLEAGFDGADVDDVDPSPVISCQTDGGLTSNDPFAIGSHDITCRITDASGNFSEAGYVLQVLDVTAPQFSPLPQDISASATSPSGAVVNFNVSAIDNDPAMPPTVTCSASSGSTFPVGDTVVSCTASDASGNSTDTSFTISVVDDSAPVVSVPADPVFAVIQGPAGSVVDYSALVSVSDTVDPSPTLSCSPPSGSTFASGDTTVSCTGTDAAGNSTTETFVVTVGYSSGIGIFANKYNVNAGSTNQLTWAWRDEAGNNVDSSGDKQLLRVVDCVNPTIIVLDMAGDPGSSGFKFRGDNSWEYNWQTVDDSGAPLAPGEYCPSVESELTGNTLLITPRPVRVR